MILALILSSLAYSDSFDSGVDRLNQIRARTDHLLRRVGFLAESGTPNRSGDEKNPSILNLHALPSGTFLPSGTLVFGKSHLRLLVGETASPIQVIVENAKAKNLLGLKLLGLASQSQGRIFMDFDRLILRNGRTIPITAAALDTSGALGLKGENENSRALEVGAGVAMGILAPSEERVNAFGDYAGPKKSISQRLKDSILGESRDYLREQFKEKPVLRLDENTPLTILFKEEVRF